MERMLFIVGSVPVDSTCKANPSFCSQGRSLLKVIGQCSGTPFNSIQCQHCLHGDDVPLPPFKMVNEAV